MAATWDDVRARAGGLPGVEESTGRDGLAQWRVRRTLFVWERPLRKVDLAALGDDAPTGPVLGARVADLGVKEALVADPGGVCFTTPHFDGYPAVLVPLDLVEGDELAELVIDAWLARASARMVRDYLAGR